MSNMENVCKAMIAILLLLPIACFAQEARDEGADALTGQVRQGFEEAMKNIDKEKAQSLERLAEELRGKLNVAIDDWLAKNRRRWDQVLGKYVKQNWEEFQRYGPFFHREYFLRDFAFVDIRPEVSATASLSSPYQASFILKEKLYVEKEHIAGASFRRDFFYTATTPIRVKCNYIDGAFVEDNAEYGQTIVERGWPEEEVVKLKLFD